MPLLDKAFKPADELDLPRVTYSASSEWLIADLDRAIELLPDVWNVHDYGRASKGAAYAVKSIDRKSAAKGQSVSVRVDSVGRRIINKNQKSSRYEPTTHH